MNLGIQSELCAHPVYASPCGVSPAYPHPPCAQELSCAFLKGQGDPALIGDMMAGAQLPKPPQGREQQQQTPLNSRILRGNLDFPHRGHATCLSVSPLRILPPLLIYSPD